MIRRAISADRQALEGIYDQCFPGEPGFRQWFFDTVWQPGHTLVWQQPDGAVLSQVMDIPVTVALGGRCWDAHYIYAAATLPQARGRGLMAALLERAHQDGRLAGQGFSVLITQNESLFDFYRPFGYTTLAKLAQTEAQPAPLPPGYHLRAACREDGTALAALFEAETAHRLTLCRDALHFERMLDLYGKRFYVLEGPEGLTAWGFLETDGDTPLLKEALGPDRALLAAELCNRLGRSLVFQAIGEAGRGIPNGCIKGLTAEAQSALRGLAGPPYINMMFN